MENFDKISLEEISKEDLLIILQALTYTHEHTQNEDFLFLRDSIIKELAFLTKSSSDEILEAIKRK